jgi:lysophospholipase L1-like esterase
MRGLRIVSINIFIFLALLGALFLVPPIAFTLLELSHNLSDGRTAKTDTRASLSAYSEYKWADRHFDEFNDLKTDYWDYYVWRRRDFHGDTINITNGVRETWTPSLITSDKEFWFFGGSTTWGTGVDDEHTYPSLISKDKGYLVKNFGESGYIASQSLFFLQSRLLIEKASDLSGVTVVFVDGINDVEARCRVTSSGLGSSREHVIAKRVAEGRAYRYSFNATFLQLQQFISSVATRFTIDKDEVGIFDRTYDCDENPDKVRTIVSSLLNTWELARDIVEERGGTFYAVLQPVAYVSRGEFEALNINKTRNEVVSKQFATIYPLLQIEMQKRQNLSAVDLTHIFDGCFECYIDFAHFGPAGSELMAKEIIKSISGEH